MAVVEIAIAATPPPIWTGHWIINLTTSNGMKRTALSRKMGKLSLMICDIGHLSCIGCSYEYDEPHFPARVPMQRRRIRSLVWSKEKTGDLRLEPNDVVSALNSTLGYVSAGALSSQWWLPFCAFFLSVVFSEEVASTRRWSSSRPIKPRVSLGFSRRVNSDSKEQHTKVYGVHATHTQRRHHLLKRESY